MQHTNFRQFQDWINETIMWECWKLGNIPNFDQLLPIIRNAKGFPFYIKAQWLETEWWVIFLLKDGRQIIQLETRTAISPEIKNEFRLSQFDDKIHIQKIEFRYTTQC